MPNKVKCSNCGTINTLITLIGDSIIPNFNNLKVNVKESSNCSNCGEKLSLIHIKSIRVQKHPTAKVREGGRVLKRLGLKKTIESLSH